MKFSQGFGYIGGKKSAELNISLFSNNDSLKYEYANESARLREIAVSDDGLNMIAIDNTGDKIFEYQMSTPWVASTAVKSITEFATSTDGEINPQALYVRPDGEKLYYSGFGNDTIYQYSMSTPWRISTLSSDSKTFGLAGNSIWFELSYNGLYLYAIDATVSADTVRQYNLSTPWDISTASNSGKTFEFTGIGPGPAWITQDGTKMVISGLTPDVFYQYTFSDPWQINTLTIDSGVTLNYATETTDTHCSGLSIKPDDFSVMIMAGGTTDFIYQLEV